MAASATATGVPFPRTIATTSRTATTATAIDPPSVLPPCTPGAASASMSGARRGGPLVAIRAERGGERTTETRRNGRGARNLDRTAARQPRLERLARRPAAPVRTAPEQRLVDGHREAELVRARIERLAPVLLERHVPRRAGPQRLVRRSRDAASGGDGQPQVRHPEPAIATHQEILGLDVPVHETRVVDGLQPARGLEEHAADLRGAPRERGRASSAASRPPRARGRGRPRPPRSPRRGRRARWDGTPGRAPGPRRPAARAAPPGPSPRARRSFRETRRSRAKSWARYTTPIPPLPRQSSTT